MNKIIILTTLIILYAFNYADINSILFNIDKELSEEISNNNLTGNFEKDRIPESQKQADLGGDLFFSPDLSINGTVSCASCHHPSAGGADGLSLPVGITALDPNLIGLDRLENAKSNTDMFKAHGLIPRNTPSVINSTLFTKNLFWDGRVQYDENNNIITGNSGPMQGVSTNYLQEDLLQTQARMPMSSFSEMKGPLAPYKINHEIEEQIINFLREQPNWCQAFANVYGEKNCDEIIVLENITKALADFQATLVFTDFAFKDYIKGDKKALTEKEKKGGLAFFRSLENGGLGCAACHSGDTYTNENFYNLNIPSSGVGENGDGLDFGRYNVDKSAERFSFRVPSLINVTETAPYFHNGTAITLEAAIRMHQKNNYIENDLDIIKLPGIDYDYANNTINNAFINSEAYNKLPNEITEEEIENVTAFLKTLTDPCLKDEECKNQWKKDPIMSEREKREEINQTSLDSEILSGGFLKTLSNIEKPNVICKRPIINDNNTEEKFQYLSSEIGINHEREIGFIPTQRILDIAMKGSVSAIDLNNNCLIDLVFDAGENGVLVYEQLENGNYELKKTIPKNNYQTALVADIDGDYKYDLFRGTLGIDNQKASFYFDFLNEENNESYALENLSGPVVNMSMGDILNNGFLDVSFAFWRTFSSPKQTNIWFNDGKGNFYKEEGLGIDVIREGMNEAFQFIDVIDSDSFLREQNRISNRQQLIIDEVEPLDLSFTPNFVDVTNNNNTDLLMVADYFRSQVFFNENGRLIDNTNRDVINENNGMGTAIGDFNNNQSIDWFVTSIKNPMELWYEMDDIDRTTLQRIRFNELSNQLTGHKLYLNEGEGTFISKEVEGGNDTEWGWGACAADFNNNGFLDIFYVSGFGGELTSADYESYNEQSVYEKELSQYQNKTPVLLLNDGNANFRDASEEWGLNRPLDGRGIACFDHSQNGAIDIVVVELEGTPTILKNKSAGLNNWTAFKFIGLPGNTEAFGTKVKLYTENGIQYREVRFSNNYISRNPADIHFGLGQLEEIKKVEITLPAPLNKTIEINDIDINQLNILDIEDLANLPSI